MGPYLTGFFYLRVENSAITSASTPASQPSHPEPLPYSRSRTLSPRLSSHDLTMEVIYTAWAFMVCSASYASWFTWLRRGSVAHAKEPLERRRLQAEVPAAGQTYC